MAICDICGQEMSAVDTCFHFVGAIPYGEEKRFGTPPKGERCHDCGVKKGGYHHSGCDMEECPNCGEQLISCDCGRVCLDKIVSVGMKDDGMQGGEVKPRYDLIPVETLEDVAKVLTFGAKKYDDDNWRLVENADKRYYSALMRHVEAWRRGEQLDSETNLPHLAHAVCCLMFLNELGKGGENNG